MKTAAVVTIHKPGAMSKKGRREIAKWLRERAKDLEELGDQMNDTGPFTAKYHYRESK